MPNPTQPRKEAAKNLKAAPFPGEEAGIQGPPPKGVTQEEYSYPGFRPEGKEAPKPFEYTVPAGREGRVQGLGSKANTFAYNNDFMNLLKKQSPTKRQVDVLFGIMGVESGLEPDAGGEASVGLFQQQEAGFTQDLINKANKLLENSGSKEKIKNLKDLENPVRALAYFIAQNNGLPTSFEAYAEHQQGGRGLQRIQKVGRASSKEQLYYLPKAVQKYALKQEVAKKIKDEEGEETSWQTVSDVHDALTNMKRNIRGDANAKKIKNVLDQLEGEFNSTKKRQEAVAANMSDALLVAVQQAYKLYNKDTKDNFERMLGIPKGDVYEELGIKPETVAPKKQVAQPVQQAQEEQPKEEKYKSPADEYMEEMEKLPSAKEKLKHSKKLPGVMWRMLKETGKGIARDAKTGYNDAKLEVLRANAALKRAMNE